MKALTNIPAWFLKLEATIFTNLPAAQAMNWQYELVQAMADASDLELVKCPMMIFVVECALDKVQRKAARDAVNSILVAIKEGSDLEVVKNNAREARSAKGALFSDRSPIEAAIYAADSLTANTAANSCAVAAERIADSVKLAKKLLSLVKECK